MLQTALQTAILTLTQAGCDTARLDAELLLAHCLNVDRSWLYAHHRDDLDLSKEQLFQALVLRRRRREPLAYIVGHKAFFGRVFRVTPDVLIPRPDTEILVALALDILKKPNSLPDPSKEGALSSPFQRTRGVYPILDIGTGCGCIAISLACQGPAVQVIATDISKAALKIARDNARRHQVAPRITFVQADLLAGLSGLFDMILSNPPYIAAAEMRALAPEVRNYEPALALTDGDDGLQAIKRIVTTARQCLSPGGSLLIEIGADQGPSILSFAQRMWPEAQCRIEPDLAGRDRVLVMAETKLTLMPQTQNTKQTLIQDR